MVIAVDTREQKNYVADYFDKVGQKYVRTKLFTGDYARLDNMTLCIDRKDSIQELCGNCGQQHERFRAELERAKENGIKLIVLVADEKVTKLSDLGGWYNYRLKKNPKAMTGKQLMKICHTLQDRYGVEFQFCKKADMGKRILKLLEGVK